MKHGARYPVFLPPNPPKGGLVQRYERSPFRDGLFLWVSGKDIYPVSFLNFPPALAGGVPRSGTGWLIPLRDGLFFGLPPFYRLDGINLENYSNIFNFPPALAGGVPRSGTGWLIPLRDGLFFGLPPFYRLDGINLENYSNIFNFPLLLKEGWSGRLIILYIQYFLSRPGWLILSLVLIHNH